MVSAVIFDFYGTLAHFADTTVSNYETVFAAHGYRPERAVLDSYFARYDGVDHAEHSVSEEAYEAWVRARLRDLTGACGVPDADVEDLIDALRGVGPGSDGALSRGGGDPVVAARGGARHRRLLELGLGARWVPRGGRPARIWSTPGSPRPGPASRKPHPGIYAASLAALGVDAADVVFVGDSWEPDVRGPRRLGMTAVHVWREEERSGQRPPALEPGDHRVGELTGVLEIVGGALRPAGPAQDERIGGPVRP